MESLLQTLEAQLAQFETDPNASIEEKIDVMCTLGWELRHINNARTDSLSRQAYDLAVETGYERGQVHALRNIMTLNMRAYGKIDLAMSQVPQALAIADKLGDREVESQILNMVQTGYKALGNYPEAVSIGLQAIELSRQTGNRQVEVNALHDLAVVYTDANNIPPAIETFLEILQLTAEDERLAQTRALATANLGECYLKAGDYIRASYHLQQAVPLTRQLGMKGLESFVLDNMGRVAIAQGYTVQAMTLFEQAYVLAQASGLKDMQAYILGDMGRIVLKTDATQALEILGRALELAINTKEKLAIIECHQGLAEAYEKLGNAEKALAHYKQFHALKEEVFNEAADQKLKILQITHETESAKREAEINRLKNVSLEVEIAERKKAEDAARQRAEELAVLIEVGQDISATLDLTAVFEKIADRAKTALQACTVTIILKQPNDQTFRSIVVKGKNAAEIENFTVKPGIGIAGHIIQTGLAEIINDPSKDSRTVQIPGTELPPNIVPEALMCAPLILGDVVIGLLTLWREQEMGPFTPSNLNYLIGLAQQAAVAIQNARLFEQAQKQLAVAESLREVAIIVNSSLDQTTVIAKILEQLGRVIQHDGCAIFLLEENNLVLVASNDVDEGLKNLRIPVLAQNPGARVFRQKKLIIIDDVLADPGWKIEVGQKPIRNWMGAPLMVGETVIGVLTTDNLKPKVYTHEDGQNLQTFANHAALAIENARLFEQEQKVQKSLFSKIEELSVLNYIMQTITRTVEINTSLQIVAGALVQQLQIRNCGITLLNETGTEMEVVASASLDENYPSTIGIRIPVKDNLSSLLVINTQQSLVITQPQTDPLTASIHPLMKTLNTQCLLISPLLARGNVIGTIGLDTDQPNRTFTADEVQLVETVAGQIAGAIRIAYLFDKEQRQRQVAESLQEVALVLNSSLNLKTVIDKILEQLRRVIHCNGAGLFLQDKNTLLLIGGFGFDESLIGYRIPLNSDIITAQIFHSQTSRIIEDVRTSPFWDATAADPRIRSWMAVPLLSGEKTIGVLTADNFNVAAYSAQDTQTLQIFATQAAVAIENARLFKELEQAKETAENASKAKTFFLSTMSHELRTPLNGILGYTQLLQRDSKLNPDQLENLSIIEQSGNHLLTLINDLLDLAKIEAGKLELQKTEFNLPNLLKNVSEMIYIWISQKKITYHLETGPLPTIVHGDEKRLRQVLINLLGNAVKFTKAGHIILKVTRSTLDPSHKQNVTPSAIRFSVEDTGIGILPEDVAFIFEPFRQVNSSHHSAKGTGLGLAVCRSLVTLMDGTLDVTSQAGQGSTFWFELPLPEVETDYSIHPIHHHQIIGVKGIAPNLLIIDDNTANRKMLSKLLSQLGFNVHVSDSGSSGLKKALATQPDAIITDLIMPEMDGFELARQVRQSPILKDTVIIANSANAYDTFRQQSLEAGCNAFIAKPIRTDELLELLQNLLGCEYIFKESDAPNRSTGQMVYPPSQILNEILELLLIGDVRATEQKITQMEQAELRFKPFADQIHRLTRNFKIDEACQYLQSLLLATD